MKKVTVDIANDRVTMDGNTCNMIEAGLTDGEGNRLIDPDEIAEVLMDRYDNIQISVNPPEEEDTPAPQPPKNSHILWDVSNRNHWAMVMAGSLEECKGAMRDDSHEIHANEVKESWNSAILREHHDMYMDGQIVARPMTAREIKEDGY